ncbi:LamG domain-containing protein [Chloroflexi bacterium TSY]|nr:LamG domain-containing protein [Chloroflexi bacterium TSY]
MTKVLQFDGDQARVEIPHADIFDFDYNEDFTIEVWAKSAPEQPKKHLPTIRENSIIDMWHETKYGNSPYCIRVYCQDLHLFARRRDYVGKGFECQLRSSRPVATDKFEHFAFVKDSEALSIYLNGELDTQKIDTTDQGTTTDDPLFIGNTSGTMRGFKGQIAEVRIWKRARTVQALKATMHQRLTGEEQGLVGYWPLDQVVDGKAHDLSGNKNHGTVYHAVLVDAPDCPLHPDQDSSSHLEFKRVDIQKVHDKGRLHGSETIEFEREVLQATAVLNAWDLRYVSGDHNFGQAGVTLALPRIDSANKCKVHVDYSAGLRNTFDDYSHPYAVDATFTIIAQLK